MIDPLQPKNNKQAFGKQVASVTASVGGMYQTWAMGNYLPYPDWLMFYLAARPPLTFLMFGGLTALAYMGFAFGAYQAREECQLESTWVQEEVDSISSERLPLTANNNNNRHHNKV